MKVLAIRWQRLVDESGKTCQRCSSTEKEVQKALKNLKESLAPLGIKVALEKKALDPDVCAKDILQSNRIWIGEKSLEEWLGASVDKSLCGFCCAELDDEVECRTVEVKGQVYETIPADLIIKAGLLAASKLYGVKPSGSCDKEKTSTTKSSTPRECCPSSDSSSQKCK